MGPRITGAKLAMKTVGVRRVTARGREQSVRQTTRLEVSQSVTRCSAVSNTFRKRPAAKDADWTSTATMTTERMGNLFVRNIHCSPAEIFNFKCVPCTFFSNPNCFQGGHKPQDLKSRKSLHLVAFGSYGYKSIFALYCLNLDL